MKTYARLDGDIVMEIIPPITYLEDLPDWQPGDPSRIGQEIPIEQRFSATFVSWLVDITGIDPQPDQHWTYDGFTFFPPAIYTPGPDDILASNRATQGYLLSQASQAMTPVFLALQLGDATDDETLRAKAWRSYYQALNAVDLTSVSPEWPTAPAE